MLLDFLSEGFFSDSFYMHFAAEATLFNLIFELHCSAEIFCYRCSREHLLLAARPVDPR